ncbi:MAG: hypothetical protein ACXVCS_11445 [Bdellovibrionota bacterium]
MIRAALLLSLLAPLTAHAAPMALITNLNYADGNYCSPEDLAKGCVPKKGELASLVKACLDRGIKRSDIYIVPPVQAVGEAARLSSEKGAVIAAFRTLLPKNTKADIPAMLQAVLDKGPAGLTDPTILARLQGTPVPGSPEARAMQRLSAASLAHLQNASKGLATREAAWGPIDKQMKSALDQIRKRNGTLEVLSISGHSTGNEIFGETSYKLSPEQVRGIVKTNPELVKSPHRIYLPGCYTLTQQEFDRWHDDLKARTDSLIVGYDDSGFSRRQTQDWAYIERVSDFANQLDRKTQMGKVTENQIRKGLYALDGIQGYRGVAISYCGHYIAEKTTDCGDQWEVLGNKSADLETRYLSYEKVPEEEPPTDTSSSPLRSFYTLWQRICSAKSQYPDKGDEDLVNQMNDQRSEYKERSLRTIFWKSVEANFVRCHASEVSDLKTALSAAGLSLPLDGNAGRRDFVGAMLKLNAVLAARSGPAADSLRQKLAFVTPLWQLNNVIPPNWVDLGASCNIPLSPASR